MNFQEAKAIMEEPIGVVDPDTGDVSYAPDPVTEAKEHLVQVANFYNLCVACVDKVIAPKVPQIAQTTEFFTAAVTSLFTEGSLTGQIDKMPKRPTK